MYCSRDYYYSSRFNQQYEKPTPTLDLIITEENSNIIKETGRGSLISGHNLIHFILQMPSKITTMKQVSYRKTKAIDISLLKSEVLMEVPYHGDFNSPDYFVELYSWSLNQLMEKFTPQKTRWYLIDQSYHG